MRWFVLLSILLFVSCKINQTKNGVPVGKWKYIGKGKQNIEIVKGKYNRLGNEKGVWKYYNNDTLYRWEKYYYPYCVNVLYHSNGVVSEIGKSVSSNLSWAKYGVWYQFDKQGNLTDSIVIIKD